MFRVDTPSLVSKLGIYEKDTHYEAVVSGKKFRHIIKVILFQSNIYEISAKHEQMIHALVIQENDHE
jgi:hypothetical protein